MIIIADTSPLNYLIRLGKADVLREIYGRVLVPHAVLIEMKHPEAPLEVRAWASAPPRGLRKYRYSSWTKACRENLELESARQLVSPLNLAPTFF
jgi:hypothetical protein